MSDTDLELLKRYASDHAEDAFAEIVRRHLDLVHSAAHRQVRSTQLAEEVAQSVFADLARNSDRLAPDTILTAWLYQVTRRTAIDVVRREARRQLREQIATEMNAMNANAADWTHIEPLLDEAMSALDETDRAAVLLRYFENKSLREVGATLGTSDDAAQKRVSRAVERLREFFAKRGVTVGASGLVVLISTNAIQAAPVGLVVTISSAAALVGATFTTTGTATAIKTIAMTSLQKTLVALTIAAALGTGIYGTKLASTSSKEVKSLREAQDPLISQLQQITRERDAATNNLAILESQNVALRLNSAELPRLRGEVARSREDARELARLKSNSVAKVNDPALEAADKTWTARASRLKQRLEQMPEKAIPEFQFLSEKNWFDVVKNGKPLETDADYRMALSELRQSAKVDFSQKVRQALTEYAKANGGQLPAELSQLKPYFSLPVDDASLQRYSLLQAGKLGEVPRGQHLVAEIAPAVDDEYDTVVEFNLNDMHVRTINKAEDAIKQAGIQYALAHDGLLPTQASQIAPYLNQPLDTATFQKLLSQIPPGVTTLDQLKAAGMIPK